MKGAFSVRDPAGPRWEQALDFLSKGEKPVLLDGKLAIERVLGDAEGRGRLQITVLTQFGSGPRSRKVGQKEVDGVREPFLRLVLTDDRLRSLLDSNDVTWEYAEDLRGTMLPIAPIAEDGVVLWPTDSPPGRRPLVRGNPASEFASCQWPSSSPRWWP